MPTLDAISDALIMLDKYQVEGGSLQPLRSLLVSPEFLKNDPIRVYSLVCYWKFKEEADLAASHTSALDVLARAREEDIQRLTGMEYHRILILEKERRSKTVEHISDVPASRTGCAKDKIQLFHNKLRVDFGDGCYVLYEEGMTFGIGRDSRLGRF